MTNRHKIIKFVSSHPSDISGHLLQIYDTVVNKTPKIIVELCSREGMSTFVLSMVAQDVGAKLASVTKMNYLDFADTFKDTIDVLLIDTSHTFEDTINELKKFLPKMNKQGIIIMHDTNIQNPKVMSRVGDAINFIFGIKGNWKANFELENDKTKIVNFAHNNGMAFIFLKQISEKIKYITVVNNFSTLNGALLQSSGVNNNNIIIIDNTLENKPISFRYNIAIKEILKDQDPCWIIFCHQDFYIGEDLSQRILNIDKNCIYGPIGRTSKGQTLGRIIQTNGKSVGQICDKCDVETLDAMCMIVHKDIIEKHNLLFDESFRFHFYVEDFSIQARMKGIPTKILQMNCQHRSRHTYGTKDTEFYDSRDILIKKWNNVWTTTGFHHLLDMELPIESRQKELSRSENEVMKSTRTTIIIVTKNIMGELFPKCLANIKKYTHREYQIVVVETHFIESGIYNLARDMNIGLRGSVDSEYYVSMNDDVFVEEGWLDALIEPTLEDNRIGIVGALLLLPDGKTIQHAGVICDSTTDYMPGHRFYHKNIDKTPDVLKTCKMVAVTGALVLITRKCRNNIGLWDSELFPLTYNDPDYCIRAWLKDWKVVYNPKCRAIHMEGQTVKDKIKDVGNKFCSSNFKNKWNIDIIMDVLRKVGHI